MEQIAKKRKKQYSYHTQKRKKYVLEPGLKGFFCSCNVREKDCVKESYNVLNEYADELYGAENKEITNSADADDLYEEIQAIKSAGSIRRFQVVDSGAKNIVFIRTTLEDPVNLAKAIVNDVFSKKEQKTRYLIRLVPIEATCKAYLDDIKKSFESLIEKYFSNPTTFSIVYNHRNNNNLLKDEVISTIADMVIKKNPEHKVDLTGAQVSVVIEIIRGNALIGIVPDYIKYKKYNLHALCENTNVEKPTAETDTQ
ncbi:hypothetical protein RN001_010122 [Aquatica leii]|uniref:THUMP domain-containing protein n=1 Tax=Aquatica leii TaxID=1421715 RepID=A0AAN7P8Z1_9COLE|nr:hypothetical protein RN001_010122 [Aquatica leii]